jgi:hypothetical protein
VGAGWRFLKSLEKRILCRLVHTVGALDERDTATPFNGEEGEAGGEGADRFNADLI